MKLKYTGVIFDLDGTLVNTLEDIALAMNLALKSRGFPELPPEAYIEKVGWGLNRLAFLALPEDERKEDTAALLAFDMLKFYTEKPITHSAPYPGILELINTLKGKKIKTAVLTNKQDVVAQKVIAALFQPGSFDYIQGESRGKPRKPDPEGAWELMISLDLMPASTLFVGDSEVDMETAVAAGCFPLGVSWGYRSKEAIKKGGARRIIDDPCELLEFFL